MALFARLQTIPCVFPFSLFHLFIEAAQRKGGFRVGPRRDPASIREVYAFLKGESFAREVQSKMPL
jgi:hypothetical protein